MDCLVLVSLSSLTHWDGGGVVGLCQTPVSGTDGMIAWDLMVSGPWDLATKTTLLYTHTGSYCWQNMFPPSFRPPSEGRARKVLSRGHQNVSPAPASLGALGSLPSSFLAERQ